MQHYRGSAGYIRGDWNVNIENEFAKHRAFCEEEYLYNKYFKKVNALYPREIGRDAHRREVLEFARKDIENRNK